MQMSNESRVLAAAILATTVLKDEEMVSEEMAVSTFFRIVDELREQNKADKGSDVH